MPRIPAQGTSLIDRHGLRTVIFSDIVEGTIRQGMKIQILLNTSVSMTAEIEAIEFMDRMEGRPQAACDSTLTLGRRDTEGFPSN